MTHWRIVTFEPLDVLINTDARGLADGGYAHEGAIFPAAFAGVLRSKILRRLKYDFRPGAANDQRLKNVAAMVGHDPLPSQPMTFRFAGPLFAMPQGTLVFPLPGVYRDALDGVLGPRTTNGCLCDEPLGSLAPLAWKPLVGPVVDPGGSVRAGVISAWELAAWLRGEGNDIPDATKVTDLVKQERRWGHVRAKGGAPKAGGLFSRGALRFEHHVTTDKPLGSCYAGLLAGIAEDLLPNGTFTARLAGEGRLVTVGVRCAGPDLEALLGDKDKRATVDAITSRRRALVYLATPALFKDGWRPTEFLNRHSFLTLKGGAVGPPIIVAGWDWKANAPKAPKRAVPAGSVYFFEVAQGATSAELKNLVETYHGGASVSDWDGALGFGLAFIGTW
jgi:CRISPR type III-B/RAMP module-associated protein Cmr3